MFNYHAFPLSMARAMYKYIHFQPIITSVFPGGGEKTTSLSNLVFTPDDPLKPSQPQAAKKDIYVLFWDFFFPTQIAFGCACKTRLLSITQQVFQ